MSCSIRLATLSDEDTVVRYNAALALESEGKRLDPAVLRAGVRAALADPNKGFYVIAERDGAPVGQSGVTFEWSDWRNGWFWWIQSVYVARERRGRGVYSALHEHVRAAALASGEVIGLRLYVERENARAQRLYRRLGMAETYYRLYEELLEPSGGS
jgi:ribosomal protein S18 acetylase RimI-like enzyme